ncbi:hypothetical protein MPER_05941 [Moniliophthora perniciosa FA553]|nr:hypothetical protein MPER_05941 [Moniliophthora perniciosa FA553]
MGVNIILTLLTASRIWWISREARKHMGPAIKTKYNTIVVIILESGILYPIFVTTGVIFNLLADPDSYGSAPFSFSIVRSQVAGIAPTLIIIRAARGKTFEHTSMYQVDIEARPSAEGITKLWTRKGYIDQFGIP